MPEPLTGGNFSDKFIISKFSGACTGCLDAHNGLDSQRPDVIARAYEAPHIGGHDNSDSFSNNIVDENEA